MPAQRKAREAAQLISGKHVKMNYAVNDNPSQQVGLEDLISVRRFGRFKVLRENGLSKNGKHKEQPGSLIT